MWNSAKVLFQLYCKSRERVYSKRFHSLTAAHSRPHAHTHSRTHAIFFWVFFVFFPALVLGHKLLSLKPLSLTHSHFLSLNRVPVCVPPVCVRACVRACVCVCVCVWCVCVVLRSLRHLSPCLPAYLAASVRLLAFCVVWVFFFAFFFFLFFFLFFFVSFRVCGLRTCMHSLLESIAEEVRG